MAEETGNATGFCPGAAWCAQAGPLHLIENVAGQPDVAPRATFESAAALLSSGEFVVARWSGEPPLATLAGTWRAGSGPSDSSGSRFSANGWRERGRQGGEWR
jgi:hypothetical protein